MNLEQKEKEIMLLMDYAVDEKEREAAKALVKRHNTDHISLNIFREFYSYLPDAENDSIKLLRTLTTKQGTFLIAITTSINNYLYLATAESAEFLGIHDEGIWDKEVLEFFGMNREKALELFKDLQKFPIYVPAHMDITLCPICSVKHGEFHRFGCSIEVCPWCKGQLTHCDCRFKKLNRPQLTNDSQVEALEQEVEKKGRIAFNATEQGLLYPGEKK